ncbi:hypothetical protein ACQP2X_11070 [Actinoplanes sp. CA-131856]
MNGTPRSTRSGSCSSPRSEPREGERRRSTWVARLASALLERGHLRDAEIDGFRLLRSKLRHLRRSSGWPSVDWPNWHRANDSLFALRLMEYAQAGDQARTGRAHFR